ncbi:MAG TPA: intradiol ring-cleavage dioxygenase [Pilimelia sp.]|nr:intradiol ring-cleavage dioxygenase [Pilimelia sp.]
MEPTIGRRRALAGIGSVGLAALLAACTREPDGAQTDTSVPTTGGGTATVQPRTTAGSDLAQLFKDASTCALTPEQTEGPYYFDVDSIRGDIREDRTGTPLRLAVRVMDADGCTPVSNAVVDIWHCDATGLYSGFESASTGGGAGNGRTDQKTYLRGAQVTNVDGIVEFRTIYPGWYQGRTVHIHTKVHLTASSVMTTQLYFDDAITDQVYAAAPYNTRPDRTTRNSDDGIVGRGGASTTLTLSRDGDGYLGLITLGVAA